MKKHLFFILMLKLQVASASQFFTIQGRLLNADGTPITSNSVQFKAQVRTTGSENCLLYEETQTIDMSQDQGAFSFSIGQGSRAASSVDGGNSLEKVFSNAETLSLTAAPSACANLATSFTPTATDTRNLVLTYNDGSGWDTIPTIPLSWIPQAMYAQDSGKLGGKNATQFLSVTGATPSALSASDYTSLIAILTGTSTTYVKTSSVPTCVAGEYLTASSGTITCAAVSGASGGTVTSVSSANAYLSVTNGTSTPSLTLNVGTTANTVAAGNDSRITGALQSGATAGGDLSGTYPNPSVAAGAITATKIANGTITNTQISNSAAIVDTKLDTIATAGKVSGSAITSGTIGGSTSISTSGTISSGNITSSGTISGTTLSATNLGSRNVQYFDSGSNKVTVQSPTTLAANYSMTLPPALPASNGYVLSSDTSGVLSWIAPLSGDGSSLTNLNASNISSGTLAAARLPATVVQNGGNAFGAAANVGTTDAYGINFLTNNTSRMTIDSSGNVGVGISTPSSKMNIKGSDTSSKILRLDMPAGQSAHAIFLADSSGNEKFSVLANGNVVSMANFVGYGFMDPGTNQQGWFVNSTTASVKTANTTRMTISNTGDVGIGTTAPQSPLHLASSVPASANKGLACFGPGPFDGSTAGYFSGSANGTVIAANATSGYTGSLIDLQVAGSSKFKVDNSGNISSAGTMAGAGNYSTAGNISTTLGGTITSSGNMYATSGSASTSSTTGALVVTGGAGISGALNVGGAISSSSTVTASTSMTAPTMYGSSSASGNLTLDSTSNGTKGNIILAPSGGSVGIGTSSPSAVLDVYTNWSVGSATNIIAGLTSYADMSRFTIRRANGSSSAPSSVLANENIGNINFRGYGSTSFATLANANIMATATENFTDTAQGTAMSFWTTESGTTSITERMRINQIGNVGIGTSSPQLALDVNGNARIGVGPSSTTTSPGAIANSDTTLTVTSTTGYPSSGILFITDNSNKSEAVLYTGKTATTFTGVTRAAYGSTAKSFAAGATIDQCLFCVGTSTTTYPNIFSTQTKSVGIGAVPPAWMGAKGLYVAGSFFTLGSQIAANWYNFGASTVKMYGNSVGSASDYWGLHTNSTERIRVDGAGNVGIGTSSPQQKLQVSAGDISLDSGRSLYLKGPTDAYWRLGYNNGTLTHNFLSDAIDIGVGVTNSGFAVGTNGGVAKFEVDGGTGKTYIAGNLGIGTTSPGVPLDVGTTTSVTVPNYGWFNSAGSAGTATSQTASVSIRATGRIVGEEFNATSDQRLKENIKEINYNEALQFILKSRPVHYKWKFGDKNYNFGFLAQDLLRLGFDEFVSVTKDESVHENIDKDGFVSPEGFKFNVNYNQIVAILTKAIKDFYVSWSKDSANIHKEIASTKSSLEEKANKLEFENAQKDKKIRELEERLLKLEKHLQL